MENYKGKLQEIFQKYDKPIPVYPCHKNEHGYFICSVKCYPDKEFLSHDAYKRKKDAEQNVAEIAYNYYTKNKNILHEEIVLKNEFVLVDLDNITPDKNKYYRVENGDIIGFCNRETNKTVNFDINVIDSLERDATDIAIILYAQQLVKKCNTEKINLRIVTKDHFGNTFVNVFKQMNPKLKFEVFCTESI